MGHACCVRVRVWATIEQVDKHKVSIVITGVPHPRASPHSQAIAWDPAKLRESRDARQPAERAQVKRRFDELQVRRVDAIKQQRREEETFTVRSKALLKRGEALTSEVVRTLPVGAQVRVLERRGNRVRLADGWTSVVASSGGMVLLELGKYTSIQPLCL